MTRFLLNMKKNKKFEEYALKIIKKYQKILLLDGYMIDLTHGVTDKNAIAQCRHRYPYRDNDIMYSDGLVKMWEDGDDIVPIIVHELCHIVTDPFYTKATKRYVTEEEILEERESLTEHISNIIIKHEHNNSR